MHILYVIGSGFFLKRSDYSAPSYPGFCDKFWFASR